MKRVGFTMAVMMMLVSVAMADSSGFPLIYEAKTSWIGPEYEGKFMSNGQIYTSTAMVAGVPKDTFEERSLITVRNIATGKSVDVVVADHFRPHHGKGINLSRAAADYLGLIDNPDQIIRVIPTEYAVYYEKPLFSQDLFYVQIGSFDSFGNAEEFALHAHLKQVDLPLLIAGVQPYSQPSFLVLVGGVESREQAKILLTKIKKKYSDAFLTTF